jgi:hypothetical protein
MRDPDRIPELCAVLQQTWSRYPDMRLGQLLVNAIRPSQPCPQVFAADDGFIRRGLERLIEAHTAGGAAAFDETRLDAIEIQWRDRPDPVASTVQLERARVGTLEFTLEPHEWGGRQTLDTFATVLELRYVGEYRHGSLGNPDAEAMLAAMVPHLHGEHPDVALLDCSALRYAWGDSILRLVQTVAEFDSGVPVDVVVLAGHESRALAGLMRVYFEREQALREARRLGLRRAAAVG